MPIPQRRSYRSPACTFAGLALPVLLAACGGGSETPSTAPAPANCSVSEQKTRLGDYMNDWYFWYRLSPRPDAGAYASVESYFDALLYTGIDASFPRDRWSRSESTESFNRFFGDGSTLGYGVSVNGIEVSGLPNAPLLVRYVEPLSPAAVQGVRRGDRVLAINGRSAADIIASGNFSLLTPAQPGDVLTLRLLNGNTERTLAVTAREFMLAPVSIPAVVTSPLGRRLGYVLVKDMINQALAPLESAFAQFRAQGVEDVVLDLRYNGGGLVSVGAQLGSLVAGTRGSGRAYATLLFNDQRAGSNNITFRFSSLSAALGLPRVFVLSGPRTCSASEQLINGLRGVGVEVVAIGDTSCGKPVGSLPTSACGRTYSVVNFESVNERNEGRYFDGFGATCPVAEDFSATLGAPAEPLLAAAGRYADSNTCVPLAGQREQPQARRARPLRAVDEGEQQGLVVR